MKTQRKQADTAGDLDREIGERVHGRMWNQKVSQKEIGVLLGIDATGVGKKLRAEQKFSIAQLVTIAGRLNTTVAYLVGETPNPSLPDPNRGTLVP